jgi:hypothetical protein
MFQIQKEKHLGIQDYEKINIYKGIYKMIYGFYSSPDTRYNEFLVYEKDKEKAYNQLYNREKYFDFNFKVEPGKWFSLKKTWEPFKVEFASKGKTVKLMDISSISGLSTPVFSEKAREILGDYLNENGEFLEIICVDDGKTYYAYNVLTYVDIIEENKTETIEHSLPRCYLKQNIDFEKLSIFKILCFLKQGLNEFSYRPYYTQKFLDRVNKYKLKGLWPRPIRYIEESLESYKDTYDYKKFKEFVANEQKLLDEARERDRKESGLIYIKHACKAAMKMNKEKTLNFLKQAFSYEPSLKEKAKNDVSFEFLFNDDDFKNLIN